MKLFEFLTWLTGRRAHPSAKVDPNINVALGLARKLVMLRLFLIPRQSKREYFYYACVRPALGTLLGMKLSTLRCTPPTNQVQVLQHPVRTLEQVHDILLIKADHIGDFLLAIPCFMQIKRAFPQARITLLCGKWNEASALALDVFDRVAVLNIFPEISSKTDGNASFDPKDIEALNLPVFDLAIDLKSEPETRVLLKHIRAKFKAGYESNVQPDDMGLVLPQLPIEPWATWSGEVQTQILLSILVSAVISTFEAQKLMLDGVDKIADRAATKKLPAVRPRPTIGINTGSGAPLRNWPLDKYIDLIRLLDDKYDVDFVLFGSPAQNDDAQRIFAALPDRPIRNLIGQISLLDFYAEVRNVDLYIGHDTGGTHIAAALNVNTLCIFSGCGRFGRFGPVGKNTQSLRADVACAPCGLKFFHECAHDHRCIQLITVDIVAKQVEQMLGLTTPKALAS